MKYVLLAGLLLSSAGVAHADPAWCANADQMEQGSLDEILGTQKPERVLLAAAYLKCHPREAPSMAKVDAAIQASNKAFGLTDADWADVADFARAHGNQDLKPKDDQAAWSTRDPIEQFVSFLRPTLITPGTSGNLDRWDLADIFGSKLSQAGRLGLVSQCIGASEDEQVELVLCQGEIDALDFAKLDAEIRADKTHSGAARMTVRIAARDVKLQLKGHAADVAKLVAKDETWKKLFAIVAQERKDWEMRYREKADLLAVADTMDDAIVTGSRKASAGCKDKTWDQLAKAVAALPAKAYVAHRKKDEDDGSYGDDVIETVLSTLIGDPNAYLAANAFTLCHVAERSEDILAINLQPRLSRWPGFRGPRTGAITRITLAAPEFDDRNANVHYPHLDRFWMHDERIAGQNIGIVASVKPKGDKATVAYKQKLVKSTYDTGCTQGRLHSIRSDGSLEYEINCTGHATVMVDRRPAPEDISARYATTLKPGMQSLIRKEAVFVVWAKEGDTIPALVLGQPVK